MFTTDEDYLFVYDPKQPDEDDAEDGRADANKIGWIWFIYGNDGHDVVSDYTTNLEKVLQGATALAEELAG